MDNTNVFNKNGNKETCNEMDQIFYNNITTKWKH